MILPIEVLSQEAIVQPAVSGSANIWFIVINIGVPAIIAFFVSFIAMRVKLSVLETDLKNAKEKISALEGDMKDNSRELNQMKGREEIARKSPLSLTDAGKETLLKSGAQDYIEENKNELLEKFKGVDNAFDIQEKSRKIIKDILESNSPELKKIKSYLFTEGKELEQFVAVMAIGLRDVVLSKKNIPISKVDSDQPAK